MSEAVRGKPEFVDAIASRLAWRTEPNAFVAQVHDRMSVILEPQDFERWETGEPAEAAALTQPAENDVLQAWPVSTRVNSSRALDNDASLVERVPAQLGF